MQASPSTQEVEAVEETTLTVEAVLLELVVGVEAEQVAVEL